jgi:hypothetical protein
MKRFVKITGWGAVGVAALYALLEVTVGVDFHRPVALDNDPLTNSVAVASITSNRLTLADGRVLVVLGYSPERLKQEMRDSGGRVELEPADSRFATLCVKKKRSIHETHRPDVVIPLRHAPAVVIPLLRREYPAYYRHRVGLSEFQ